MQSFAAIVTGHYRLPIISTTEMRVRYVMPPLIQDAPLTIIFTLRAKGDFGAGIVTQTFLSALAAEHP